MVQLVFRMGVKTNTKISFKIWSQKLQYTHDYTNIAENWRCFLLLHLLLLLAASSSSINFFQHTEFAVFFMLSLPNFYFIKQNSGCTILGLHFFLSKIMVISESRLILEINWSIKFIIRVWIIETNSSKTFF